MDKTMQTYLYSSVVSDDSKENEFLVEFYSYEEDGSSKPAAITKDFNELIEFLEQYEEE